MQNRIIKFRAWDAETKEMHYPEDRKHDTIKTATAHILKHYDCIMQFTGLHDKNGKEIYEGDLLKDVIDSKLLAWKVMFKDGCFGIRNIGIDGSENHAEFHAINSPYFFTDRVIINNIYEAPQINL